MKIYYIPLQVVIDMRQQFVWILVLCSTENENADGYLNLVTILWKQGTQYFIRIAYIGDE